MEVRAEIELKPGADGAWSGQVNFPDTGVLGVPVHAEMIDGSVTVSGGFKEWILPAID